MGKIDYQRIRRKADKLIARFGQPTPAKLRRAGVDRNCTAVLIDYRSNEKGLRLEGARRLLVSTFNPTTRATLDPPDHEQDMVVFNNEVLRIVKPDEGLRPGGTTIFHDLEVVYDSRDV